MNSVLKLGPIVCFHLIIIFAFILLTTLRYISLLPDNVPFMEAMQMKISAKQLTSIITESLWTFGISLFAGMITGGAILIPGASA